MAVPVGEQGTLEWTNVAIGLVFILFDVGVSTVFRLGVGVSLLVAAFRCIGQLAVVATLLQQVFDNKNPWLVSFIAFILNFLGTFEIVVHKSPRRFLHMFPAVLVAMLCSTIPISILGSRFAMSVQPFWTPIQYIPIVGMLCGATISGIVVAVSYILKELQENKDKTEIYLAFGASRTEACRPVVIQALRVALTPPINNMSVLGIIAIPGMMTGAILGGSSVHQAAKLQIIIMFMITASTTLASVITTFACIAVTVDEKHRIRSDRIEATGQSWFNPQQW
ncbi:ABC transporter-like protein, partial [Agrocybe pediades]